MAPDIPPPCADPHPPRSFTPPVDACDAHCHVFGPAARFPFADDRAYTPPDAGIDSYEVLRQRLGLSRAVFVQASCHGTDNAEMIDAIAGGEGRYAGVAMIDPSFTTSDIHALHDGGVRGARFNFVAHLGGAPDLDDFWTVVHRVAAFDWHVVLHFDAKDFPSYGRVLDEMPCRYVIDHMARIQTKDGMGQPAFEALLSRMRDDRAWVKVSGAERLTQVGPPSYDDVVPFARALIAAAPGRVLWGTDWPHPNVREMPDDGDLIDLLTAFAPDEAVRNRILVANPATLYDF